MSLRAVRYPCDKRVSWGSTWEPALVGASLAGGTKRQTGPAVCLINRETNRKSGEIRDSQNPQASGKSPGNAGKSVPGSSRLKIVVSPVRVRVSPSTECLESSSCSTRRWIPQRLRPPVSRLAPDRVFPRASGRMRRSTRHRPGRGLPSRHGATDAPRGVDQARPHAVDRGPRSFEGEHYRTTKATVTTAGAAGPDLRRRVGTACGQAGRPRRRRLHRHLRQEARALHRARRCDGERREQGRARPGLDRAHDRDQGLLRPRRRIRHERLQALASPCLTPDEKSGMEDPVETEAAADAAADRAHTPLHRLRRP